MVEYDLEIPEELYNFSQDCEEACCFCPQYCPWNPIDFDEGRNEVSPSEVFLYWKEGVGGKYLFEYRYYAELSEEAKGTFRRYASLVEEGILDSSTGKRLSEEYIQVLVFGVKE